MHVSLPGGRTRWLSLDEYYESALRSNDISHVIRVFAAKPGRFESQAGFSSSQNRERLRSHVEEICTRALREAVTRENSHEVHSILDSVLDAEVCSTGSSQVFTETLSLACGFLLSAALQEPDIPLHRCRRLLVLVQRFSLPQSPELFRSFVFLTEMRWASCWVAAVQTALKYSSEQLDGMTRRRASGHVRGHMIDGLASHVGSHSWTSVELQRHFIQSGWCDFIGSDIILAARRDLAEVEIRHFLLQRDLEQSATACKHAVALGVSSGFVSTARGQLRALWAEEIAGAMAHWSGCNFERVLELCEWAEREGLELPSTLAECRCHASEMGLHEALGGDDLLELDKACELAELWIPERMFKNPDVLKHARRKRKELLGAVVAPAIQTNDLAELTKLYFAAERVGDPAQQRVLRRRIGQLHMKQVSARRKDLGLAIYNVGVYGLGCIEERFAAMENAFEDWMQWSLTMTSARTCTGIESLGLAAAGFPVEVDDDLSKQLSAAMLSTANQNNEGELRRACLLAEESGVAEADIVAAKTQIGHLWLQWAIDECSFFGVVAAAEWTEEEDICVDARLRALEDMRASLRLDMIEMIEDNDWKSLSAQYRKAVAAGVDESALEEARAKLNSLGPELAVACLDKGQPCRAVKVCMTAQEVKLECPPWTAARERAKAVLEAELDDGIRCRKPQQIMWACNARYGAAAAGVDAVRILGARECARKMLLDDVQDAISKDSACQISRAVLEAESAQIYDKVVRDARLRLEQLRADAEQIEAGRAATVDPRPHRSSGGGGEEVADRQLSPITCLSSVFDVSALHQRTGCLLARRLSESVDVESFVQASLSVPLFSQEFSRLYSLADCDYGRHAGGQLYKPTGWVRWSIKFGDFEPYRAWDLCYHGTDISNVLSILMQGLRKPRGQEDIAHGQAYSNTRTTIYASKSIGYASHPVYSQFFKLADEHWGQVVFECRARPGSYGVAPGTLGNKHWPDGVRFDPNFPSLNNLEWLIEEPQDVVVTGLMMREFGANADPAVYGPLACLVTAGDAGPEFEWSRLLATELKRKGMMLSGF